MRRIRSTVGAVYDRASCFDSECFEPSNIKRAVIDRAHSRAERFARSGQPSMLLPGVSRLLPPLSERIYDAEHERILMVFRRRPLEDIASLEGLERSLRVRPV